MPRDTRRLFEIAAAKQRPLIRDAFLQAIADIKRTADLDALITALERGDVSGALAALKLGPEYFAPLDEAVRATFAAGGNYALDSLPRRNPATGTELVIRFQGRLPRAEAKVANLSQKLIDVLTRQEAEDVSRILVRGLADMVSPRQTALDLVGRVDKLTKRRTGGVIGLDWRSKEAVVNYRASLTAEGRKADQIDRMVSRYSDKLLKRRGERITQHETLEAMNAGRVESMRQMSESGEVAADAVTKTWDSTGDAKVRPIHVEMDGQKVGLDEPFISPTGARLMFAHDMSQGAGGEDVLGCRCYTAIEVDFYAGIK